MMPGLGGISYKVRLDILELFSLEYRGCGESSLEVHKIEGH